MNRHERRRLAALRGKAVDAYNDPEKRDDYNRGAAKHFRMFRLVLENLPAEEDRPRFALLPKDVALIASIGDGGLGRKLARNPAAHALIEVLLAFAEQEKIEPPTYMMLRAFIEACELASEETTVDALGITFSHEGTA